MPEKYQIFQSKIFKLCKLGKYSDAYNLCQEQAQLTTDKDDRTDISLMISYILEREGRFNESLNLLCSTAVSNTQHRGVLDQMIRVLIRLGLFEEAMTTADRLIELDSKFRYQSFTSSAYFHKAYAAWKSGQLEEAKAALDKSSESSPIWIDGALISKEQLASTISQA
jgi:tetratricopeptide (TPR) repeat protein